jgi:hypothetical protein
VPAAVARYGGEGASDMALNVASGASGKTSERTFKIRRKARAVGEAMRFAKLAVSGCGSDCRSATALAVAELAENMIKYGARGDEAGTIAISVGSGVVRIRSLSATERVEDARVAKETIRRVSTTPKVKELYRKRLAELLKTPTLPRTRLGLLRITFEGDFKLSCSFEPPFLEIVAERRCSDRR